MLACAGVGSTMVQRHRVPEKVETLVVSGGGMKGVASLGAVVALKRAGALDSLKTVVGTSAGALVAAALATDRASLKVLESLVQTAYEPDIDLGRLLASFGVDSGRHLDRWIATLLGGQHTFSEVQKLRGIKLVVCATNLTERRAQYFSVDTAPDMDVALALRMSCSIPLYFAAVRHGGKIYVDGAVSDNFPLTWASAEFGCEGVLGIAFRPRATNPASAGLDDYVGALIECSTRRAYSTDDDRRVIMLDTGARSAFEFGMARRDMRRLFCAGAKQARDWLKKTT